MKDKKHWYDGIIYDKFIAPNQDRLFKLISALIPEGSTVLDIGCGTGRLEFQLAEKCDKIVCVDLSSKNIILANKKLKETNFDNVKFVHGTIENIDGGEIEKFDFAVMTYVIHEVDEDLRLPILKAMKEKANKLIIGDYLVPRPDGFWSKINTAVEFAAGREHYKNFKSFTAKGGLQNLAEEGGFTIVKNIQNKPNTAQLVVLE
ncbi:MAG: class I SAM-dependent methyltransferase [Chlorobi bacterium]|nr:class I SAM-dependent methyltransferase [Chlorobiota bacterium]